MSDLKTLREELRMLRKEKTKPVSRMKKGDIAAEIERLKVARAETPAAAAVPSAPMKKSKMAVETVKQAKAMEFPVVPDGGEMKKGRAKKDPAPAEKKKSKGDMMAALMKMMESDSEED